MLQIRKSRFCGISVIFYQCYFMIETQVLMAVSNIFFLGIAPGRRLLYFSMEGLYLKVDMGYAPWEGRRRL